MRVSLVANDKPVVMIVLWSRERVLESCRPDSLIQQHAGWVEEKIS